MFSSDACCFRNGQLKQLNDGEGWEKQEHFIHAKTLEKNSCKPEWKQNKKHLQKIQPPALPFLLYTIFHEKGTPFNTLFRTLYPFWLLYISALFFFYIEINLKNGLYTDVVLFFFSFLPPYTGGQ